MPNLYNIKKNTLLLFKLSSQGSFIMVTLAIYNTIVQQFSKLFQQNFSKIYPIFIASGAVQNPSLITHSLSLLSSCCAHSKGN